MDCGGAKLPHLCFSERESNDADCYDIVGAMVNESSESIPVIKQCGASAEMNMGNLGGCSTSVNSIAEDCVKEAGNSERGQETAGRGRL